MRSGEIPECDRGIEMARKAPDDKAQALVRIGVSPASYPCEPGELTIAEVCRKFLTTPRTLRFYESRKLLAPLHRDKVRYYRAEDCIRLALILKLKALGFTLVEIAAMLESQNGDRHTVMLTRERCAEQLRWLQNDRARIDGAIVDLETVLQD